MVKTMKTWIYSSGTHWFPDYFILWRFISEVFWAVTTCSVMVGYRRFGGARCLHLQGEVTTWRWHGPLKHRYPTTTLPRVTTQKNSNYHRRDSLKTRF